MLRRIVLFSAAVMTLLLLDQVVKAASISTLRDRPPVEVIPNLFNLAYVENRGCAWGMFQGAVWPLAFFGVAALAFLVWKRRAVFGDAWVAPCLIYAGIVGNLVDRVFRGYVIDMLDFHWGVHHFPCFNLADVYICVAAGLLALDAFLPHGGKKGA